MRRVGNACRHCGSPARGHPCWHYISRDYDETDAPAPCVLEQQREEYEAGRRTAWVIGAFLAAMAIGSWLMLVAVL
jgi:hypothetical protein